jgi:hypothetical protein
VDGIVAPQGGKETMLNVDVSIGLVIGKRIIQCDIEHLVPPKL